MRNTVSVVGCCALGFQLVACGGVASSLDAPSFDAGASIDDDDGSSDVADSGASDRDGAMKQDGSVIENDGGVGAPPVIDPIVPGEARVYDVAVVGDFPACNDGTYTSSVGSKQTLDGRDSYSVSSFCPSLGSYSYATDGDRVWEYVSGQWIVGLDSPVQDGHSWTVDSQTFTWHSAGPLTVPAGTFSDCWEAREDSASESYSIFLCRGAGPVHWSYRSAIGGGYDAVLHSKNF